MIILIALIYGCRNPLERSSGSADIMLHLILPDYHSPQFIGARAIQASYAEGAQSSPRMVDPSTSTVEVTISAADIATISQSFSFADTGSYSSGAGEVVCNVTDVPFGSDRQFEVITKDTGGTIPTQGTASKHSVNSFEQVAEVRKPSLSW